MLKYSCEFEYLVKDKFLLMHILLYNGKMKKIKIKIY